MNPIHFGQSALLVCLLLARTSAGDVDQLLTELQHPGNDQISGTLPVNEAIRIRGENVSTDKQEVLWREECLIECLDEQHWRLDSLHRFPEPISYCGDNDLWFVAINRVQGYGFDRVGFDADAASSIEMSIRSRAEAVFAATHVLELPVQGFVTQIGISFSERTLLTNPKSQKGVSWDLEPPAGSKTLRSHGALEWRLFESVPRITHLRYAFGKRPSPGQTTTSGIEVNLEYDLKTGRTVPIRVVRTDAKSLTTTVITRLSTAQADLTYYSPASFGLDRPRSTAATDFTVGLSTRCCIDSREHGTHCKEAAAAWHI